MKKLTLILTLLVAMVTTAMAQDVYLQKINHVNWVVTALNEAGTSGNEGGVAYIADADPKTFYHSNWSSNYTDGNNVNKGKDGLQAFLIELPMEYSDISKITYTGRSDKSGNNPSGWATKVRIYLYQTLPADLSAKALSALTYAEKEALLVASNTTVLGEPVFNNNDNPWSGDQVKTIELATPQTAKYILFVMDASTDGWLTCSDFNIYQKLILEEGAEIKEIVEDKPYYLKITNAAYGECYLDIKTPYGDTSGPTIGRSDTPVVTYFKNLKGALRIHTEPGYDNNFLGVSQWCATPQVAVPAGFFVEYNTDGTLVLLQDTYKGDEQNGNCYLGGDAILSTPNYEKIFTGANKANAIKIELVELDELQTAKENARVALLKTGPGYPATNSEARTTLEAAMNGTDAATINEAVATYKAITDVALPEVGKVYRFVSALPNYFEQQFVKKAMYNNSLQLMWQNYNQSALNQMWAVMDCNTENKRVTFINLDDARSPQGNFLMRQVPNYCTLAYLGEGQFNIKSSNGGTMHTNNHGSGAGNESNIVSWGGNVNSASAWYIEEVDVTKDMITAFAEKIDAAYAQSCLLTNKSTDLANAVNTVKEATNENYASAFVNLMTTLSNTEINYIDEGYFYMKSKGAGQYAYNDNNNGLKATSEKTKKSVFKLTKANDGTYYIQTDGGYYAQNVAQSQQTTLNTTAIEYRVERLTTSDHYIMRPRTSTATHEYLHDAGWGNIVGWSKDADNTQWIFEPLSIEELEKIYTLSEINTQNATNPTITYKNDSYTGNKEIKQAGGFYMLDAAPSETDFTVTPAAEAPLIDFVSVNGKNLSLNVGYNGENVFTMRCVKENSYARYHKDCWLNIDSTTNMITYQGDCIFESLFLIEEGTDNYAGYYTIRPLVALDRYAYNLNTADEDSKVATMPAPAEGGLTAEYYWKISSFGENVGNITPYHEGGNTGDAYGWNKRGGYEGKNHIGYWWGGNSEDDNKWYVKTLDEEFIPIHTLDDSVLGYANYESVKKHLPYTEVVTADGFTKLKAGKYDIVIPKSNAYYRLKNGTSNWYATSDLRTDETQYANKLHMKEDGTKANTIWYLAPNNAFMSYTQGQYLAGMSGTNDDWSFEAIGSTGNVIKFDFANTYGQYQIQPSSGRALYGDQIRVDAAGDGSKGNNYGWFIEKVLKLPVTITEAGYASFYAPVAVELPDGVTAHTITYNTELKTATLSEGLKTVPANTGVILAGAEGDYDLKIIDVAEALENENILTGTTAATYIKDDAYVLGYIKIDGENVVGFGTAKKNQEDNTSWKNNSHKAYLPKDALPAVAQMSAGFRFEFSGTTAIEKVESRNEKEEIYDLTGRKLECINGAGIYIINGKKVLIK